MHLLRINPLARQDLIDIKEYITNELDNPTAAINVILKIIDSYEKLKEFPILGVALSSKIEVSTDYRYLISQNHIIFYKADDVYIDIYRILSSRRDYVKILFNEQGFSSDTSQE